MKNKPKKQALKKGAFLKQVYFAFQKKQPILPEKKQKDYSETIFLLRNIANNINQIAKRQTLQKVNTFKKVAFGDLLKVKNKVHQLEKIVENGFLK